MILQGDPRVTEFYIQALLEHECQFFIIHENRKKVRVAFTKGAWKLMREDGEKFELNDSGVLNDCPDTVLEGFILQRLESRKDQSPNWFRTYPALVMVDVLKIWLGPLEDVVEIDVRQAGRDGWFVHFND